MKMNINPMIMIIIILEIVVVFSLLYFLGEIKLARIVLIFAFFIIFFGLVLLFNNKMSKRQIVKILSPYWREYLESNYTLEREIQLDRFIDRHKKLSMSLFYIYLSEKVSRDFWELSRSCAEAKEYLPKDAWEKHLSEYLENTLGFPEREIRLFIVLKIKKFI